MDAIAVSIGGASPAGGIDTIMRSLIGALVYMSLTSGMNLMGTDISHPYIVRGAVLALAIIFDVVTRRRGTQSNVAIQAIPASAGTAA